MNVNKPIYLNHYLFYRDSHPNAVVFLGNYKHCDLYYNKELRQLWFNFGDDFYCIVTLTAIKNDLTNFLYEQPLFVSTVVSNAVNNPIFIRKVLLEAYYRCLEKSFINFDSTI